LSGSALEKSEDVVQFGTVYTVSNISTSTGTAPLRDQHKQGELICCLRNSLLKTYLIVELLLFLALLCSVKSLVSNSIAVGTLVGNCNFIWCIQYWWLAIFLFQSSV